MNNKVVILTGAGISAESGLRTFRDNNGLWENHRLEDVATPDAFSRDPGLVYRFYNQRRQQLLEPSIKPNTAHNALADLEQLLADDFMLITQNVDNLHERAGSQRVLHMHGELMSARCCASGQRFYTDNDINADSRCRCCKPASRLRPDIVWFGEIPMHMPAIERAIQQADWFVSIGTSGHVYPAAGFVEMAKYAGAKTVELNLEAGQNNQWFDIQIHGPASVIVPQFINEVFMGNQP
ncbi:Sir2 family NAD+-dependent deacetylase [Alteromonas flava]|uniref:Sir2 family NAD+-dependent deacetylase n=1 Tax=Alteromonas flava TaxID=2048003 RepID=UPI000C28436B|nr:Sir2 family NAD+-dependent deacetylase [Alteromonas flava]